MKLPHWFAMFALIVAALYVGKIFGARLPNLPGMGG